MIRAKGRGSALCFAVIVSLWTGSVTAQSQNQNERYQLDIPAQPLGEALRDLGRAADQKMMFSENLVRSYRTTKITGSFTVTEALAKLLSPTNLDAEKTPAGVIVIKEKPADIAAPVSKEPHSDKTPPKAPTEHTSSSMPQSTLEEVMVTARRREEKLQDVPIAVTVLSGDQLTQKGVTNVLDLTNHVPSLRITPVSTSPKSFAIGIRGLRASSDLLLDDAPVGTYFAEGVVGHPYGFGEVFYDIQSVQVLKGPQGTLFGRNTTGGAVLVEPNKPSLTSGFGGYARVGLGNYHSQKVEGAINIPLHDVAAVRVAGVRNRRDGYTTNVLTGQQLDDVNTDGVRVSLLVEPVAAFSSNTIFDYLREDSAPPSIQITGLYPGAGAAFGGTAGAATWQQAYAAQIARGPREVASPVGTNGPLDALSPTHCAADPAAACRPEALPEFKLRTLAVLNNTQLELEPFTIKNIASYRDMKHRNDGGNLLPSPTVIGIQNQQNQRIYQWTEELQFLGKAFANRLDWVTGAFYMKEWGTEFGPSYNSISNPTWQVSGGTGTNKSLGIFLQGTYALTDKLKTTLGVRRNKDEREASDRSFANSGRVCLIPGLSVTNCHLDGRKSWSANTWTASVDYQAAPGTLLYAASRRGYKSGGFSLRSHDATRFSYDPEFITDFEIGLKSDWRVFDMPVRTNLAVFHSKYSDQQLQVSDTTVSPIKTFVDNVGKSRINGVELEVTAKPTNDVEISGFFSYTDAKILEYRSPSGEDLSYRGFGIPKYLGGLSATYSVPLASAGTLGLRADAAFRSKNEVSNTDPRNNPLTFAQFRSPGLGLLNLRMDWTQVLGSPIDAGIFVINVTDKVYTNGGANIAGIEVASMAPPRMYGLELAYKFGEGFKPR